MDSCKGQFAAMSLLPVLFGSFSSSSSFSWSNREDEQEKDDEDDDEGEDDEDDELSLTPNRCKREHLRLAARHATIGALSHARPPLSRLDPWPNHPPARLLLLLAIVP
jgi:hypothetical protein